MGRGFFQEIGYWLNSIYSIVYGRDDICIVCGEPEDGEYICSRCKENIKILNLKTTIEKDGMEFPCHSLGIYSYSFKKLILLLKYEKEFIAGKILADYLGGFIEENLKNEIDLITFIPSSKESFRSRGFNQCEVICKYISKGYHIPYESLMYKTSNSRDQIGLDNNKRWDNVKNSFELKNHKSIKNKRVLLIDDVITSGATSFYGAKCLKENGAGEVYILTVAKSRV